MKKNMLCYKGILIAGTAVITLTGCSKYFVSKDIINETVDEQGIQDKIKETNKMQAQNGNALESMEETVNGMNEFALHLFQELPEENSFFSPYSISVAISMLDNAAENDTKEELENLLGIKDLSSHNLNIKTLLDSYDGKGAIMNTANSVWWSKGMTNFKETMKPDFLDPLRYYYGADVLQVDFTESKTIDQINDWIGDKTNEMIPKMLEKLDESTVMCLVNAVYFEGIWQNKFTKERTWKKEFNGVEKTVQVDMMQSGDLDLHYYEMDGMRGIELPYEDSTIAMQIILPEEGSTQTIHEVFDALTTEEQLEFLNAVSESERKHITYLGLPKFSIEYEIDQFVTILKTLGMVDSFDETLADFGKINDLLYVSDVMHKARIEVDEEGSKAAAATLIATTETGAIIASENIEFLIDQPFIYVIRDTSTGTILFLGYMNQL